ncbi:MAG TPA: long-chain fatty acid--CoA ligase [Longimicrobiales bacterium]|nr:long-chain fatty acid--CoA ligase [Longimicrobiales bacterium]
MATGSESTRQYAANPADLPPGTLVELFFQAVERFDSGDALRRRVGPGEWQSIGHRELLERVRRTALGLGSLGLERGQRVAILSENRPEWAQADWAALCAGITDIPVYDTLPSNQIAYILNDAEIRLIFVSNPEQLRKVEEIWEEVPSLRRAVLFDGESGDERVLTLAELEERGAAAEAAGRGADFKERALQCGPDDIATMLYTSGTTGKPKGVLLSHNNIHSNVRACMRLFEAGPADRAVSFLPLSHILERMVDYWLFSMGVTVAYVHDIALVAESLREVHPTIAASTPRLYEKVYDAVLSQTGVKGKLVHWAAGVGRRWTDAKLAGRSPGPLTAIQHAVADRLVFAKLRGRIGGSLRFFISGGAPLADHVAKFFYGAGVLLLEGYGLTETSPVTNVNTEKDLRFGTVGKPVPGTEVMIAEDGEILIRGPQVMKGYYKLPEATAEAMDADGWFHTGDVGQIDADGYLKITDRKKDIIVTAGGKNIAPQPIENRVKESAFVDEAVMIGDRRPYAVLLLVPNRAKLEEWAGAAGIRAEGPSLLEEAKVREKMEQESLGKLAGLARFERPKKIALLEGEFTVENGILTPSMKVKRRVVEERFGSVIEALYQDGEHAG